MIRFAAFGLLSTTALFASAFERSEYVPSSIIDAVDQMDILPDVEYHFDAEHPRFKLVAIYEGERRPITAERRHYLEIWIKSFRHPTAYLDLFQFEVQIQQDGRTYWMPIQQSLVEAFEAEIKADAVVELYATGIGAWKQDPIFLVNAFEAR